MEEIKELLKSIDIKLSMLVAFNKSKKLREITRKGEDYEKRKIN
jgi:hypothetical protein